MVLSHRNMVAGAKSVAQYLENRPSDRILAALPLSFDAGFSQLTTAFHVGASVTLINYLVPRDVVDAVQRYRITGLTAVPPLWIQLLGVPAFREGALRGIRIAQNAGGHLPVELVRQVRAAMPEARLFLQYGMTETFRTTYLPPGELDRRPGSMGRPMPDTEVLVLDDDGRPVASGEVGELVHRGPTIALGYWNDPETTSFTFRTNPARPEGAPDTERVVFSGDMVRRDDEGFLYYVSRRDRLIKTMGFRVGPDEIADALYASGQVHEAIVDSESDVERGAVIVAYVVLRDGGSLDDLKRYCRAELPEYAQPARNDVRPDLPRLAGGKHDLAARVGRLVRTALVDVVARWDALGQVARVDGDVLGIGDERSADIRIVEDACLPGHHLPRSALAFAASARIANTITIMAIALANPPKSIMPKRSIASADSSSALMRYAMSRTGVPRASPTPVGRWATIRSRSSAPGGVEPRQSRPPVLLTGGFASHRGLRRRACASR
mgnify:CR=1 FL=1